MSELLWWHWGLAVCMAAFLGTAGYLVWCLHQTLAGVKRTEARIGELHSQALRTVEHSERMVDESMKLVKDAQRRLQSTDDWVAGIKEAGAAVKRITRTVGIVTRTVEETVLEAKQALNSRQDTVSELIEWTTATFQLIGRLQASGQSKSEE